MKTIRYLRLLILCITVLSLLIPASQAASQDDNEGRTFDFSPYEYSLNPSFSYTNIGCGEYAAYPYLYLESTFKTDQKFKDWYSKWWREYARYVHEIEERRLNGNPHFFTYDGIYGVNLPDTEVEYEYQTDDWPDNGDDPELELHVKETDDTVDVETEYLFKSGWESIVGFSNTGLYTNEHLLTAEVDGTTGSFLDYDLLDKQSFSFMITRSINCGGGGGGPYFIASSQNQQLKYSSKGKSSYYANITIEKNMNLAKSYSFGIRKFSGNDFKIFTHFVIENLDEQVRFNAFSKRLLKDKLKEDKNHLIKPLITFKRLISLSEYYKFSLENQWNVREIRLSYLNEFGDLSYANVRLDPRTLNPFDKLNKIGIYEDQIQGIYFIKLEAKAIDFYNFYLQNNNIIKLLNLASLYAETWLIKNGTVPETIEHLSYSNF